MHTFILRFGSVVTILITYQKYSIILQVFGNDGGNEALHKLLGDEVWWMKQFCLKYLHKREKYINREVNLTCVFREKGQENQYSTEKDSEFV